MELKEELTHFIQHPSFPCLMAKAVSRTGHLEAHEVNENDPESCHRILENFARFYASNSKKLSSCVLGFPELVGKSFDEFEAFFWAFLRDLRARDRHPYDSRVSADPENSQFSFSVGGEAFFILLLHPESPRLARRFRIPAIVFNPHAQFEAHRKQGVFEKIRNLIRAKDLVLQADPNPMLNDYGESSEVFQYTGRNYEAGASNPLMN